MFQDVFIWLAILVAGMILLRLARRPILWAWTRPNLRSNDFDLNDLQKMVAKGLMTQEEYLKARDVILSRTDARHEPVKGFPVLGPVEQERPEEKK
jgi:hypothetical protein